MAAPLTAGAAALIRAAKPDLKAVEITTRLIDTAAQIDGPITKRLDVAAALGIPSSGGSSRAFRAFLPALSA